MKGRKIFVRWLCQKATKQPQRRGIDGEQSEKEMRPDKGRKTNRDEEQVEELLQAVQDELVMNLSVDSHMSKVSPDYLDSDLVRRFQALKSRPTSSSISCTPAPPPSQSQSQLSSSSSTIPHLPIDDEFKSLIGDDLSARFVALKASLPSYSSANVRAGPPAASVVDDEDDEDDEVEKLIRWAKDAARLDPSPPSDDDDIDDDEDNSSDEDSDHKPCR